MRMLYWSCENKDCKHEIKVEQFEPSEIHRYRGVSCPKCYAFYSVRNDELRVKENEGGSQTC